jgi:acylphosphatase
VRPESVAARLLIHGRVQGVGYRFFAQELAGIFGLPGWVRNLPDGNVEVFVEGPRPVIEVLIERLENGPSMARVENVTVDWQSPQGRYDSFSILP